VAVPLLWAYPYETNLTAGEKEKAGMGMGVLRRNGRDGRCLSGQVLVLLVIIPLTLLGCGVDHSGQIVDLQKQITLLSRQIEEVQKEMSLLRDSGAQVRQALNDAEAEINRLKTLETLPAGAMRGGVEEEILAVSSRPESRSRGRRDVPQQKTIATVVGERNPPAIACAPVWALLGKGKSPREVAQALQTAEEQVRRCEQKIGRGSER
jgi:hypothetical protein